MFTGLAFFALVGIFWFANRGELDERRQKDSAVDDDFVRARVLFIRQDLRLVVYALMGILVMLGIIADRLH